MTGERDQADAIKNVVRPLDERQRAAFATVIADRLGVEITGSQTESEIAEQAVTVMKQWIKGEAVSVDRLNDLVADEYDRGVAISAGTYQDDPSGPAWNALATALAYVTYQAYRQKGAPPSPEVSEVRDDTVLDLVDQWVATASFDAELAKKAASLLTRYEAAVNIDALLAEIGP